MLKLVPDTYSDSALLVVRKNGTSYITRNREELFEYVKSCKSIDDCVISSITEFCSFNTSWLIRDSVFES